MGILNPLTFDSFTSVMTQVKATGIWLDFLGRVLRDVYCELSRLRSQEFDLPELLFCGFLL